MYVIPLDDEVMIRRSDIDLSIRDGHPVFGMQGTQPSGAAEDFRQEAARTGGQMQDDENSSRQIRGKLSNEFFECFYAPSRPSNSDDVMSGHVSCRMPATESPP